MSMKHVNKLPVVLLIAAVLLAGLAGPATAEESTAARIRKMTGARTKIAWIRGSEGKGHPFGPIDANEPPIWRIIVLDTDENGGTERVLTPEPSTYSHVMIAPSGKRVVWTVGPEKAKTGEVWISDWDGKNAHKLLDVKMAVAVAEDPPGTEWVYVKEAENSNKIQPVYRYQIDDLTKKELVWDKNNTNDKWEVSRDGKYAVTRWNAGPVGICALPNGDPKLVSDGGCTPGMAPDLSLVTHMRAQNHSGIYVYNRDGSNKRYIDFASQAPGASEVRGTPQFWWCGFARYDKRFYTFSGPHPNMQYSPQGSNIYFCRFNEKFDNFDRWIVVTDDPEMDTQPYAWIEPKVKGRAEAVKAALAEAAGKQMADAEALLEEKKHWEASVRLEAVIAVAPRSEQAGKAREQLKALRADKLVWAAVEKGRLEHKAAQALAEYEKGEKKRAIAERFVALEALAKNFPGTEAGRTAAERAAAMRADPEVMRQIRMEAAERDCKGWLSMARNYIQTGMPEKAKPYLDKVLQQYPDTLYAEEAKKLLAKIPGR